MIADKEDGVDLHRYWLPGFFDQNCFFSSLLQHYSRKLLTPMDELIFDWTITNIYDDLSEDVPFEEAVANPPEDGGVYIFGLTMESGQWNRKMKMLEDLPYQTHVLTSNFPVLHLNVTSVYNSKLHYLPLYRPNSIFQTGHEQPSPKKPEDYPKFYSDEID